MCEFVMCTCIYLQKSEREQTSVTFVYGIPKKIASEFTCAHMMQKSKREKTNTTKTRISSDTTCAHVGWASRMTQWGGSLGVVREVLPGSLLGWGISVMYTSSISVTSILQMFTIVSRRPPGSVGPSMTYSLCPYLLESDLVALGGANKVPDTARRLVLYYSVLQ